MSRKTIILTQKQLDEIVGGRISESEDGDATYLDDIASEDVGKEDAANNVYTSPNGTDPVTSDKFANQRRRSSSFYGLNRNISTYNPVMIACSKGEWEQKNLVNEDNQDLVNTNFTIGQSEKDNMVATGDSAGANFVKNGDISYGNAKTVKSRMNKLQKLAKAGDAQAAQTYQNMGGKVLQDTVTKKLDNATALDKRDKKNRTDMGFQNVYQKPGGSKTTGNGKAHSPKNVVITYESKVNEAKSIKSKKLFDIVQQHGGFYEESWQKNRKTNHDIRMTNADLHNLTDDQVIGVTDYDKIRGTIDYIRKNSLYGFVPGDDIDYVQLMDGKYLLLLVRNANQYRNREYQKGDFQDLADKKIERDRNRPYKGKHNDDYKWKSTDAQHYVFNNPYYKNWDDEAKEQMRNKIKDDYKK